MVFHLFRLKKWNTLVVVFTVEQQCNTISIAWVGTVQPFSYFYPKININMHFLTTIGITLAVIGAILIFILKQPLKTSDKLLIAILATFVVKFSFDEGSLITGNPLFSAIAAAF